MAYAIKSTEDQVIRNRNYKNREIVFEGCSSVGGFTDIDAVYDVKGKALVIIEVKRKGCAITTGQRILFDRLVMGYQKPVYAITAWDDSDSNEILLKDTIVREVRIKDPETGKSLVKPAKGKCVTIREAIEYIERKHGV